MSWKSVLCIFGLLVVVNDGWGQEVLGNVGREKAKEAARRIDDFLEKRYSQDLLKAYDRVPDDVFGRRSYLMIGGRIPTYKEIREFEENRSKEKRYELVDDLLGSQAATMHDFHFWADLLRMRSDTRGSGNQYAKWLKEALQVNMKYDDFVYALLTATGRPSENGAVGYYLRDRGMPLDNMSVTTQVFLGTQMQCAQCHDHPYDKWTQMDYYQMAAFTYGMDTRINNDPLVKNVQQVIRGKVRSGEYDRSDEGVRRILRTVNQTLRTGVEKRDRALKLPDDYAYDDAKPGDAIQAKTVFGEVVEASQGEDEVSAYVKWMTSPANPRFTKVIVNRLWKRVMGRGLVEPLDDFKDDTEASHPELFQYLCDLMEEVDYDLKQFQRILYYTDTFQRESHQGDVGVDEFYAYQGPIAQRMSAEQVWDSLMTLVIQDVDERSYRNQNQVRVMMQEKNAEILKGKSPEEVSEFIDLLYQARGKQSEARNRIRSELNKAQEEGRDDTELRMQFAELREMEQQSNQMLNEKFYQIDASDMREQDERWERMSGSFVRASELPSPSPLGSFLHRFGQSERQVISGASRDATVPQVLSLLNDPVVRNAYREDSAMMQGVVQGKDLKDRLGILFKSILSVDPERRELRMMEDAFQKEPGQGYAVVTMALLNTQRFLFIP